MFLSWLGWDYRILFDDNRDVTKLFWWRHFTNVLPWPHNRIYRLVMERYKIIIAHKRKTYKRCLDLRLSFNNARYMTHKYILSVPWTQFFWIINVLTTNINYLNLIRGNNRSSFNKLCRRKEHRDVWTTLDQVRSITSTLVDYTQNKILRYLGTGTRRIKFWVASVFECKLITKRQIYLPELKYKNNVIRCPWISTEHVFSKSSTEIAANDVMPASANSDTNG